MKWLIEDFVYGATDGVITTFAIVAGVVGASLSPSIVLILGFANLFADGFSMAIGNYLSTKSRIEYQERQRRKEENELQNSTHQKREEIRDIYLKKGFNDEDLLENIVKILTSRKKIWIDTLMREKFGLSNTVKENPVHKAITTFVAFNVVGLIPLFPFVAAFLIKSSPPSIENIFLYSVIFTAVAFFAIGLVRGKVVEKSPIKVGLNTVIIGGAAATVSYFIGNILSSYVK